MSNTYQDSIKQLEDYINSLGLSDYTIYQMNLKHGTEDIHTLSNNTKESYKNYKEGLNAIQQHIKKYNIKIQDINKYLLCSDWL